MNMRRLSKTQKKQVLKLLCKCCNNDAVVFADLPESPVVGNIATISDSDTDVWGDSISGGGVNIVLAFYNGSEWTVIGK